MIVTLVVTAMLLGSPEVQWDLQVAVRATPWDVVDQARRELAAATTPAGIDMQKLRNARLGPSVVAMGIKDGWFWWREQSSPQRLYGTVIMRDGVLDLTIVRGEDGRLYLVRGRGLPAKRKREPTWPI